MATDKTSNKKDKKVKSKATDAKPSTSSTPVEPKDPASKKRKKDVQEAPEVVDEPAVEDRAGKKQKRKSAVEFFGDDEEQPSRKPEPTGNSAKGAEQKKKAGNKPGKGDKAPAASPEPQTKKTKKVEAVSDPEPAPTSSGKKASKKAPKTAEKDPKPALISSVKSTKKATSMTAAEPKTKPQKKSKQKEPSPTPELDDSEGEAEASSEGDEERDGAAASGDDSEEEEVELHGFSTDEDDSSDEEMDIDATPLDVGKLPTIAKDDAVVKKKLEKAKAKPSDERGVIAISRLPHGFYEDQLKAYFSQFGDVTRLRISRNKKTGKSKHYGFVEFDSASVAQIVAETMDNYLMMGHLLQCKIVPKDKVHPELWVGANRKWRAVPHDRLTRQQHNKPRTDEEKAKAAKRLIKRQNAQKRKLAAAGIKYDLEPVSYKLVKA